MKHLLLLPLTFLLTLSTAADAGTFRDLPADVKAGLDLRLARSSDEIGASPFATFTSFEVHGESEDGGVIETMRRLGVKTVVMHNIHGSLPVEFGAAKVKYYLFEDNRGAVPTLKLFYWLPVPADDNFPHTPTSVKLSGVTVPKVTLSDCPMILRLHRIADRGGYPVLINPVLQTVQDDLRWQ